MDGLLQHLAVPAPLGGVWGGAGIFALEHISRQRKSSLWLLSSAISAYKLTLAGLDIWGLECSLLCLPAWDTEPCCISAYIVCKHDVICGEHLLFFGVWNLGCCGWVQRQKFWVSTRPAPREHLDFESSRFPWVEHNTNITAHHYWMKVYILGEDCWKTVGRLCLDFSILISYVLSIINNLRVPSAFEFCTLIPSC